MAMANTPSLNASIRPVSTASAASVTAEASHGQPALNGWHSAS
jgi:hypothetical protein